MLRKFVLFTLPLLLPAAPAHAQQASGTAGLALAALVGAHSPALGWMDKHVLALMLDGNLNFVYPANKKIVVKADSVVCRASNIDISAHSCVLTFGVKKANLAGRAAHELYATVIEVGVPGDGAAGSVFEALKTLVCTIDPNGVKQRDGSGASCTFVPGQ